MSRSVIIVAVALTLGLASAGDAIAGESKPIQLALWNPVQIFDESVDISGLRVDLIYGKNHNTTGLDFGIASLTTGELTGVQWTAVGLVDGSFTGWQGNWLYSKVGGAMTGLQWALVNQTDALEGVQLGWVNLTERASGFQLALFNQTQELYGLQIGILNIARNAGKHPVLPLVNWKF